MCKTIIMIDLNKLKEIEKLMQFIRFCIIGVVAMSIHYGIYYLLQTSINVNIAYSIGYLVSFTANFFLTSYFTFRQKPTWKRFLGFSGSHGINYLLHMLLFNVFLWLGINQLIAPFCVMGIAAFVQFTILRLVFKH